jgi:3,4-dihydroxy 2-butanone 4-phosphate synthase / GTP cyclohydrolase II
MISPIEEIIEDAREGRMCILVDDAARENEGDLFIPASHITPSHITFMATYGRGLICLPMDGGICDRLSLRPMVADNTARNKTAFTISVEAKEGVSTGISAFDRAHTIRTLIDPKTTVHDLAHPGHIFPIRAAKGGVLARAGHTEAAVEIATLCGLPPAGVICEIMNDDGTMARLDDLSVFAKHHGLKIGAIADLIAYVSAMEHLEPPRFKDAKSF